MFYRFIALLSVIFVASGCSTNTPAPTTEQAQAKPSIYDFNPKPVDQSVDAEHLSTAKRFLRNVGTAELFMLGVQREFNKLDKEQPGLAELTRRAFADFKPETFEVLAARIYAQNLSHEHILEIADYTETPTIKKFFRLIFAEVGQGRALDNKKIMKQFNADELTEIVKFSLSKGFIAMKKALPQINTEIEIESRELGRNIVQEYIKKQ